MIIQDILNAKDSHVVTVPPASSIQEASAMMSVIGIGMLVVETTSGAFLGLVSERDIIREIAQRGVAALSAPVVSALSRETPYVAANAPVNDVIRLMTREHLRHVAVKDAGRLVGVISIGDMLKSRIAEQDLEKLVLRDIAVSRIAHAA